MQSAPKSCPQNQSGKKLKLQQVKIQREHTVNRMSSSLPKKLSFTCRGIDTLVISRFGFESWIWVLIASVPDLCILFTLFLPKIYFVGWYFFELPQ